MCKTLGEGHGAASFLLNSQRAQQNFKRSGASAVVKPSRPSCACLVSLFFGFHPEYSSLIKEVDTGNYQQQPILQQGGYTKGEGRPLTINMKDKGKKKQGNKASYRPAIGDAGKQEEVKEEHDCIGRSLQTEGTSGQEEKTWKKCSSA